MSKKILAQTLAAAIVVGLAFVSRSPSSSIEKKVQRKTSSAQASRAIPALVLHFGAVGKRLIESGTLDKEKFIALYAARGGLSPEINEILEGRRADITLTDRNAGEILNVLWALGLAQKHPILEKGIMRDPRFGGVENFASTGGWTLAKGEAMDHYGMHELVALSPAQAELVSRVAANVYRPCCDNPTSFPDCNHGMAMLGALELFASQDTSEDELFNVALTLNRAWFPDDYAHLDEFMAQKGAMLTARDMVGKEYMSGSGHVRMMKEIKSEANNGASCSA